MMDRIDHSNYEAWLLDRLEGNLSPQQERHLDAFLAAHPELDPGLEELPTLDDLEASLPQADKDALKRSLPPVGLPGEAPIDDFLIARLEGDLSPEQAEALRVYLLFHPEYQRAERLYALAKLLPEAMELAAKQELQRHLPPVGLPDRYTLDDHLVARLEGDLDAGQVEALATYLAMEPAAARQWEWMARTRIAADPVVYADKAGLKKGGKVIAIGAGGGATIWSLWGPRMRAAAVVLIMLGLGMWVLDRGPDADPRQARVAETTPSATIDKVDPKKEGAKAKGDGTSESVNGTAGTQDGAASHATEQPRAVDHGSPSESYPPAVQRDPAPAIARVEPLVRTSGPGRVVPRHAEVAEVGISPWVDNADEAFAEAGAGGISLGGFLAGKLRKRVLDDAEGDTRPLDTQDALAALDKGLRTVAGEGAGLNVDRKPDGQVRRWDLRLGPNLAISASR